MRDPVLPEVTCKQHCSNSVKASGRYAAVSGLFTEEAHMNLQTQYEQHSSHTADSDTFATFKGVLVSCVIGVLLYGAAAAILFLCFTA